MSESKHRSQVKSIGGRKIRKMIKKTSASGITKKQFEDTLERVFTQPVSGKPQEADRAARQTSGNRPSDDYSDTRKSQDKTRDKEG